MWSHVERVLNRCFGIFSFSKANSSNTATTTPVVDPSEDDDNDVDVAAEPMDDENQEEAPAPSSRSGPSRTLTQNGGFIQAENPASASTANILIPDSSLSGVYVLPRKTTKNGHVWMPVPVEEDRRADESMPIFSARSGCTGVVTRSKTPCRHSISLSRDIRASSTNVNSGSIPRPRSVAVSVSPRETVNGQMPAKGRVSSVRKRQRSVTPSRLSSRLRMANPSTSNGNVEEEPLENPNHSNPGTEQLGRGHRIKKQKILFQCKQ